MSSLSLRNSTWSEVLKLDEAALGREMFHFIEDLYPICRSITGNGVRLTHEKIKEKVPIETYEVPTGTVVYDWVIPKEWNIKDAYVKDAKGKRIIDFKKHNLHVVSYSIPVNKTVTLGELKEHLHYDKARPQAIPYSTSYYKEDWGFCVSYEQYCGLKEGDYEVFIDSSLEEGSLTYSEGFVPGKNTDEIILTCYTCHPSMCNDNLSGVALITYLQKIISSLKLNYSYRFLFIPETIGAITWLNRNEGLLKNIRYGLVATCIGDKGSFTYKRSRKGDALIDRIVEHELASSGFNYEILDFFPVGSDERQFCSPGFNLPFGSLMRTPYAKFYEYHSSLDDLTVMDQKALGQSLNQYLKIIHAIENDQTLVSLNQKCEPNLGKRGLYDTKGAQNYHKDKTTLYWILNYADGKHSLLDIAEKSKKPFNVVFEAAETLKETGLLKPMGD